MASAQQDGLAMGHQMTEHPLSLTPSTRRSTAGSQHTHAAFPAGVLAIHDNLTISLVTGTAVYAEMVHVKWCRQIAG
jgi:hypothetical protein